SLSFSSFTRWHRLNATRSHLCPLVFTPAHQRFNLGQLALTPVSKHLPRIASSFKPLCCNGFIKCWTLPHALFVAFSNWNSVQMQVWACFLVVNHGVINFQVGVSIFKIFCVFF